MGGNFRKMIKRGKNRGKDRDGKEGKRKVIEAKLIRKLIRIRISFSRCGSADPDPHQHDADPQHWFMV